MAGGQGPLVCVALQPAKITSLGRVMPTQVHRRVMGEEGEVSKKEARGQLSSDRGG